MPQKKNPDIAELIRGKTGRVYGDLMGLLTVLKGLPLAYNKDMQEDKEAIFDAVDTAKACLSMMAPMVETMQARPDNMRRAAAGGFINATDCADYLTAKGMPFRDAYQITGDLVARCMETGNTLESLPLEEYQAASPLFAADIYEAISLETCVHKRSSQGGDSPGAGPGPDRVGKGEELTMVKAFIDGQAGTTGLGIRQRLLQHPAVELLEIDPLLRKDDAARKAMFQAADIAFLCLPDQAAREAAILAADCRVRLLDASTAHRTAPGWAYGFPELAPAMRAAIATGNRIAVPGCHASGMIALAYPLIQGASSFGRPLVICIHNRVYWGRQSNDRPI